MEHDPRHSDTLADLHARLARQEADLGELRRRLDAPRAPQRRAHRRRALPLALAALLVALVPLATLAAGPTFADLNQAAPVHQPNIQAIGDAGITTGFANPADPNTRLYDPKAGVTREEMASFLARTAGLGANPPVANAKTAQTASNANTVGGYAPSGLVRASRATGVVSTATNSQVVVVTITITAPAAGVAVVNAGVRADALIGTGACPCEGSFQLRHVQAATNAPIANSITIVSNASTTANGGGMGLSYAFPVDAGDNTFQVIGRRNGGAASINFYGQGTVIYVPFGPTGAGTLETAAP